ncbi:MAG TPA: hypothetical protein VIX19_16850 [Terriglobales bacterium]
MKHLSITVAIGGLLCLAAGAEIAPSSGSTNTSVTAGQAASVNANGNAAASSNSTTLSEGSMLHIELIHSLDAKHVKPGDQITAKVTEDVTSNGKVVVHKGSRVLGHVTEVQTRDKEHPNSNLGIAFDKVVFSGGEEMAFNGVVQAIAAPARAAADTSADQNAGINEPMGGGARSPNGGRGPGGMGGVAGGGVSTVGGTTGAATSTGGTAGGTTRGAATGGTLTNTSRGVIGLQGLTLNSAATGSAQGSTITSPTQNVKLDGGTEMLLRASGSTQ